MVNIRVYLLCLHFLYFFDTGRTVQKGGIKAVTMGQKDTTQGCLLEHKVFCSFKGRKCVNNSKRTFAKLCGSRPFPHIFGVVMFISEC